VADTDTLERTTTVRVQVANLPPADGGRGFARLSLSLMKSLGLNEGDVIESAPPPPARSGLIPTMRASTSSGSTASSGRTPAWAPVTMSR
jgi:hypothetical protein